MEFNSNIDLDVEVENPYESDEHLPENGIEEKLEHQEITREEFIELTDKCVELANNCGALCEKIDGFFDEVELNDSIKEAELRRANELYEQQADQVVEAWEKFDQARREEENIDINLPIKEHYDRLERKAVIKDSLKIK